MSQPNNQTKKSNNHVISGKLIIGFIVFVLLCIVFTVVAIIAKKNQIEQSKIYIASKDAEQMKIKSFTERYKDNDLKIVEEEQHIGASREAQWENDNNITKFNFYYIQIKGLKDKNIENKINKEIKQEVTSWYTNEELHDDSIDYATIYVYVYGNFGNALSIRIDKYINEFETSKNEEKSLNYNLVTGEKIQFSDLFLPGTSIKNIVSQAIYDHYIVEEGYKVDEGDINKANLSNLENKIYNAMSIYNQNPNLKNFNFTCGEIYFKLGESEDFSIDMWKYYDKIAIYHRFKIDDSIFDGQYTNDNTGFVFMGVSPEAYFINKEISDNLFEYVALNVQKDILKDDKYKRIYDEFIQKINAEIDKQKIIAKQNPDETAFVIGYFSLYDCYVDEELYNFINNYNLCEYSQNYGVIKMSTEYYKNDLFNYLYSNGMDIMNLSYDENSNIKVELTGDETYRIDINSRKKVRDIFENLLKEKFERIEQDKQKEELYFVIDEINDYSYMLTVLKDQYEYYIEEKEQAEFRKILESYFDIQYELFEWCWAEEAKENDALEEKMENVYITEPNETN